MNELKLKILEMVYNSETPLRIDHVCDAIPAKYGVINILIHDLICSDKIKYTTNFYLTKGKL